MQEAISSGLTIEEILLTPEFWAMGREWLQPLEQQGTSILLITPSLLKSISAVETPQGILAVARKLEQASPLPLKQVGLLLVSIRDPGNFGAILRTAEACGVEWIAYSSDCVDPFQSKVVRASMGSIFRVRLIEVGDVPAFVDEQRKLHITVLGLARDGNQVLTDWTPRFPILVCIGSESHGLPKQLPLDATISIPMKGKVESLNAGVAAAVFLYSLPLFDSGRVR